VIHGIKVSDNAKELEELKSSLTKWGAGKTGSLMYGKRTTKASFFQLSLFPFSLPLLSIGRRVTKANST
jgi:hypothetical protein